jgi:uncharacterized damage-inducible protein DinB
VTARAVVQLNDEQVWMREADTQNAAGNLVLHLCGNLGQWILAGVGGAPDTRDRDAEFEARGRVPIPELKRCLNAAVEAAAGVIEGVSAERMGQVVRVQAYEVTVLEAIYHVVEHFAQHTGQIIFATKLITREELGFYRHLRKPAHGEKTP